MSGLGREGGRFTLQEMSQLKTPVFKNQYLCSAPLPGA